MLIDFVCMCLQFGLSGFIKVVILLTPHGISLSSTLACYMNEKISGNAAWLQR